MPNLLRILASGLLMIGAALSQTSPPRLVRGVVYGGDGNAPKISPAIMAPSSPNADKERRPSFSLRIRTAKGKNSFPVGAEVRISITMKNLSRSQIFFESAPGVPQLSGFRPEVRDSRGQTVPLTPQGMKYFYGEFITATASDVLFPVERGKKVTQEMELNKLFALSHPGQYKIRIVRSDTQTNTVVESNILKLKLTP